mmetsp:Transcript_23291/g.65407  ORF Transcript_23291/g.65407 Transcript_23291/m.65407 type:complete len:120 (-) Transcript_23291:16-375(-)
MIEFRMKLSLPVVMAGLGAAAYYTRPSRESFHPWLAKHIASKQSAGQKTTGVSSLLNSLSSKAESALTEASYSSNPFFHIIFAADTVTKESSGVYIGAFGTWMEVPSALVLALSQSRTR